MEDFAFLSPLLLTISGLVIGAILKTLLRHTRFPYTVGLFGIGLFLGALNRNGVFNWSDDIPTALHSVANINPDLILYLFLPILIFDAAYELNLHIFKKTLANATLLAVPGLVICMLLTGLLMVGIGTVVPGFEAWTWSFALMFGALISATDPVAVVALLHELKTSKRFSTLVDAESLLNDGTGIVCFMLFFSTYTVSTGGQVAPLAEFLRVVLLSSIIGYLIAHIITWSITYIHQDDMIQNSAIILSAYGLFILSQFFMGVSGVIALVVFGLTFTYIGKPRLKPQINVFMENFWDLLTYIANTLIFLIVGVVIAEKVNFTWTTLGIAFLIYVALNLIRYAMIMLLYPIMKRMGYGLNKRESVILSWGGLRGALAMTLALMVSYTPGIPEIIREHILFFTAAIVTLTLTVNATTMRWLLNKMGLIHIPSARIQMEYNIQKSLKEQSENYVASLMKNEHLQGSNWQKVSEYMMDLPSEPVSSPKRKAVISDIRLRILDREKAHCHKLYVEGVLSKPAFMRLMNSLDELYDHDGAYTLDMRDSIMNFFNHIQLISALRSIPSIHNWISSYFCERITVVYDLGRGFLLLQKEDLDFLKELQNAELVSIHQEEIIQPVYQEIEHNINRTNKVLQQVAMDFPKAYRHALTQKSIRMLLNHERKAIEEMISNGVLTEKDAAPLLEDVATRADEINLFNHSILASLLRWTFRIRR